MDKDPETTYDKNMKETKIEWLRENMPEEFHGPFGEVLATLLNRNDLRRLLNAVNAYLSRSLREQNADETGTVPESGRWNVEITIQVIGHVTTRTLTGFETPAAAWEAARATWPTACQYRVYDEVVYRRD